MAHHEPLKSLGPIDWSDVAQDDLNSFLATTFFNAQTIVDSIPIPPSQATTEQHTRARSRTDGSIMPPHEAIPGRGGREHANTGPADKEAAAQAAAHASQLQKEWKEVKMAPKDNPMNISVYKLAAKDGRGAWFARRSIHQGIPFEKFKLGLEREFGETMRNSTGIGTGNVRGIGAERRAEQAVCDGVGKAEVWVLSAQFPGPTTPRDFITLLLTGSGNGEKEPTQQPRQFMVVSKPCGHPECAPRTGYIRGTYESVELIREVPIDKPALRQTRSSVDVSREDMDTLDVQDNLSKEMMLRAAARRTERESEQNLPHSITQLPPRPAMAVEWIMVTRSDPGGSVPRFMIERGTPGGIISDAGRFTTWLENKTVEDFDESIEAVVEEKESAHGEAVPVLPPRPGQTAPALPARPKVVQPTTVPDGIPPSGLYSMITGLVGGAASAVASHLPHLNYLSGQETESNSSEDESDTESDSGQSFASAPEPEPATLQLEKVKPGGGGTDGASLQSMKSDGSSSKASTSQHEKQLKKLQERHRKLEEKMAKQQEKTLQSKQNQVDDAGLAKLKERHEREMAKQEENFRKEAKKLEEKRIKEEKKAEERRKKEAERELRGNLAMELERTKVERDMALKQIDILKEQVGELQSQNTKLVAKLGKLGGLADPGELSRLATGTMPL